MHLFWFVVLVAMRRGVVPPTTSDPSPTTSAATTAGLTPEKPGWTCYIDSRTDARFFTNVDYAPGSSSCGGTPLTKSTFDAGVLGVDASTIGVLGGKTRTEVVRPTHSLHQTAEACNFSATHRTEPPRLLSGVVRKQVDDPV